MHSGARQDSMAVEGERGQLFMLSAERERSDGRSDHRRIIDDTSYPASRIEMKPATAPRTKDGAVAGDITGES